MKKFSVFSTTSCCSIAAAPIHISTFVQCCRTHESMLVMQAMGAYNINNLFGA